MKECLQFSCSCCLVLCVAAKCCVWLHPLDRQALLPPLLLQHQALGSQPHRANPPRKRARRKKRKRSERVSCSCAQFCSSFRDEVCFSQLYVPLFREHCLLLVVINSTVMKGARILAWVLETFSNT